VTDTQVPFDSSCSIQSREGLGFLVKEIQERMRAITPITMTHTCDFAEIEEEEWEVTK